MIAFTACTWPMQRKMVISLKQITLLIFNPLSFSSIDPISLTHKNTLTSTIQRLWFNDIVTYQNTIYSEYNLLSPLNDILHRVIYAILRKRPNLCPLTRWIIRQKNCGSRTTVAGATNVKTTCQLCQVTTFSKKK